MDQARIQLAVLPQLDLQVSAGVDERHKNPPDARAAAPTATRLRGTPDATNAAVVAYFVERLEANDRAPRFDVLLLGAHAAASTSPALSAASHVCATGLDTSKCA